MRKIEIIYLCFLIETCQSIPTIDYIWTYTCLDFLIIFRGLKWIHVHEDEGYVDNDQLLTYVFLCVR